MSPGFRRDLCDQLGEGGMAAGTEPWAKLNMGPHGAGPPLPARVTGSLLSPRGGSRKSSFRVPLESELRTE